MKEAHKKVPVAGKFTEIQLLQLLEINKAVNEAKTTAELLSGIREKAIQLIPFYDTGILIVEPDGLHHYDMAVTIKGWDNSAANLILQAEEGLLNISHPGSYLEDVLQRLKKNRLPLIENWEHVFEEWDHPFFPFIKDAGYKEGIVALLKSGDRILGGFWLNSLDKNHFTKEQLPLFKAIAEQVSVAVANILVRKEILDGEKEKTILLSISEAVATIRNKQALLKFVLEKVQPLFGFHDAGFFVFSHDKTLLEDWTVSMPEISPSDTNYKLRETIPSAFSFPGSGMEPFYNRLKEIKKPLIVSYDEALFAQHPDYPQWNAIKETGYKESLGALLRADDGDLGILFFNSLTDNHFNSVQFSLFQAIADQLAAAVANILANEDILEREREKTILLSLSEDMANIRNRDDLLSLMLKKIKPIVQFDDAVISKYSDDFMHYEHIVTAASDTTRAHPMYKNIVGTQLPLKGNPDEYVLEHIQTTPVLQFNTADITEKYPGHFIGSFLKEVGLQYNIYLKLSWSGQLIGFMNFHFSKQENIDKNKFNIYKSISEQVSVALANILANEEIIEREKEKSKLLKISEAIASIKDYKELLAVIYTVIQPAFHFDNTGIFITEKNDKQIFEITDAQILSGTVTKKFTEAKIAGPFLLKDFKKGSWYYANSPIITNLAKEIKQINDPVCKQQFKLSIEAGLHQMICGPLNTGGKKIGAFYLSTQQKDFYQQKNIGLFKSVTDLIAIGVANIIANKEIAEREKEKSLLLNISNSIAQINNKVDLLKSIDQLLWPIFHHDDAGFSIVDKDKKYFTDYYNKYANDIPNSEESRHLNGIVYRQTNNMANGSIPYEGSLVEKYMNTPPEIGKLKHVLPLKRSTELLQLEIENGLAYYMCSPLTTSGKTIGLFNLLYKEENKPSPSSLSLFTQIAEIMALAFSNILANEEIENKAREIEKLNKQLQAQNTYLAEEVEQQYNFDEMIGQNKHFAEVCRNIGLVAKTDTSVLILGETGTGKELVARAIHNNSSRKNKPLIKLNCAALPANLIESELFGHERGAFTGAIDRRIGKFELANGSTLFLDEVGELPIELQAKLLRALQEKEIERLGSNKTLQIDVRIIAATNRDLEKEVQAGKFRQDLYYRLHIFPITLPPLRERKEDIALLATHFLQKYGKKIGKNIQAFSSKAMQEMMTYNWPGNIREMEHVIERSVILNNTKHIQDLNLPDAYKKRISSSPAAFVIKTWEEQERDYILEVLKVTNGNMAGKGGAAELLQLPPTTLQSKMNKLGIKRKHFKTE